MADIPADKGNDMTRPLALLLVSMAFAVPAGSNQSPAFVPPIVKPPPERLSLYEAATWGTIVPASLLRAVAIAESGEADWAIGDWGWSRGRYQTHERWREERVALLGREYDPHDPVDSSELTVLILSQNYARFGSMPLALSAYNAGPGWVEKHGLRRDYLRKINIALRKVGV